MASMRIDAAQVVEILPQEDIVFRHLHDITNTNSERREVVEHVSIVLPTYINLAQILARSAGCGFDQLSEPHND